MALAVYDVIHSSLYSLPPSYQGIVGNDTAALTEEKMSGGPGSLSSLKTWPWNSQRSASPEASTPGT